jgi:hypothetical protein
MHPDQQAQAQTKRDDDMIRQLDEDLRFLHWRLSKMETWLRRVLEHVKTADGSTLDPCQPLAPSEEHASDPSTNSIQA